MTDMVTIEWPDNNPPSSDAEFWKQYLTEDETAPAVKEIIMPKQFKAIKLNVLVEGQKGGGGSGNFGHRGRPGHLGGSVGGTGAGGGAGAEPGMPVMRSKFGNEFVAAKMSGDINKDWTWKTGGLFQHTRRLPNGDSLVVSRDQGGGYTAIHYHTSPDAADQMTQIGETQNSAVAAMKLADARAKALDAVKMDNRDLVVKNPPKHAAPADEAAAAARINAKLDATQNFSGKPKPAANTITATARPSIKGNGTSTINRSDIKVGAVITGGNLDGYKIHTVTKFPNGSMRVVLMDEAGHIKGSLVQPKSTVAVIK